MRLLAGGRVWATLVWLAAMGSAGAQGVQWDIHAGFDGRYKGNACTPVYIEIANSGEARRGEMVFETPRTPGQDSSIRYVVPLDLPAGSRKVLSLEIDDPTDRKVRLRLGGQVEERDLEDLRGCEYDDVLLVAVSENPSMLQFLGGTVLSPGDSSSSYARAPKLAVGHARPGRMPRSWVGWEGADLVVVSGARLGEASAEEIEALRLWVGLGGCLVVNGGAEAPAMAAGPLGDLLPMQVTGTRTIPSLRALGEWVAVRVDEQPVLVADGTVRPNARVMCGSAAEPLIVALDHGQGTVLMTSFDFAGNPVKYWDGQTQMWLRLAREHTSKHSPVATGSAQPRRFIPGVTPSGVWGLLDVTRRKAEGRLPSGWVIVGFLVAYIIVLAPVSYIILARMDRREWAWITTPVVVLVFTGLGYGIGYCTRGAGAVMNRMGLVVAESGATMAEGFGVVGLFSPASRDYTLALQGTTTAPWWGEDTGTGDPAEVVFGAQRQVRGFRVNKWASRGLGTRLVMDLGEGITAVGVQQRGVMRIHVRNGTGRALRGCRLVRGGFEGPRADLAPGQEGDFAFDEIHRAGVHGVWRSDEYYYRRQSPWRYHEHAIEDIAVAELLQSHQDYSPSVGAVPSPELAGPDERTYLLALLEDPVVQVEPTNLRPRISDCTMVLVPVHMRLTPGSTLDLTPWMVTRTVVHTEGGVDVPMDGRGVIVALEDGAAVVELTVETGRTRCRATELTLLLDTRSDQHGGPPIGGTPQPQAVTIEVWDFTDLKWVRLSEPAPEVAAPGSGPGMDPGMMSGDPFATQAYTLTSPGNYMTPEGLVKVRLRAKGPRLEVTGLDLRGTIEAY